MSAASADIKRLLLGPASLLLRLVYRVLAATYRYRILQPERLEALLAAGTPVVLSHWHDQTFAAVPFLHGRLHQGGLEVTLLASQSRDGELVTRFARPWKIRTVRGSSSRGGQAAMRALHRAIVKHGASPLIIPDGPRGPRYEAKAGGVLLARFAQVPIQPLGIAADRAWRLGSWDRMFVPKPFARVVVALGEPQSIARELDDADQERQRLRYEVSLNELSAEATAALDRE